ncbi:uncharacterized protein Z519_01869 [Cladophialophora bantiana CBS 173.52]|uniref:Uncharacterized protein n=1 Tax=Cladophialophora bantiana (strain ATCC 10958 / CBS 173.52 / CDC B-1940 / NIH 8579) TaxID=1442370 RepID=A0A0D2I4T2_CLAB1|nr:uncharacterized protein Z519_01869 [Cladophialophora bantiana CBS 173.52]KIW98285.1 hypothetical protein Z519_01869 [Cladophialophora bantiana CBS 173.52]
MGPSIRHPQKELGGYHQHAQIPAAYEDCRQIFDQISSVTEANRQVWEGNVDFLESFKNSLAHWANVHHAENGSLDHALILEDLQITATPLLSPALLENNWSSYFGRQSDLRIVSRLPVSDEVLKERLPPISPWNRYKGLNATQKLPFPSDMFSSDVLLGDDKAEIRLAARLFPKAPEQLGQRLGHANWLRKCFLRSLRAGKYPGSRARTDTTLPQSGRTQNGLVETLDSP